MEDWTALNRASWDERAAPHGASPDYAVQRFVDEPDFLSDAVRFDLPRLPDVRGVRGVHLSPSHGRHAAGASRRNRLRGPSATSAPTRSRCTGSARG